MAFCLYLSLVSIHAPRTGRDVGLTEQREERRSFNPRAPYGARRCAARPCIVKIQFQSTRPVRGATSREVAGLGDRVVSIHAPRTGRDKVVDSRANVKKSFNPRAPYGARLPTAQSVVPQHMFQSTRPVRGATSTTQLVALTTGVSIHAPRTGRDVS